jgi:hypothetical protein
MNTEPTESKTPVQRFVMRARNTCCESFKNQCCFHDERRVRCLLADTHDGECVFTSPIIPCNLVVGNE